MTTSPQLSVIIICKNESRHIEKCLRSVADWVNEIVIIDSGSTDNTLDICRAYTSKIYSMDWPGFGPQKNRALEKAQGPWILSLDADEFVSKGLAKEIQSTLQLPRPAAGYWLRRHSYFCGHAIHYGDWSNDRVLRLFQKTSARFSDDLIHERVLIQGNTETLAATLEHQAFDDLSEVLDKLNHYSTLKAQTLLQQGKKLSLLRALGHSFWTFVRGYILRRGFLDGVPGFVLARCNALGCFYAYLKAYEAYASSSR